MVVVALSLLAAASYGLADFVGGALSKRTSPWAVVVVAQLAGTAAVLVAGRVRRRHPGGVPTSAGPSGPACATASVRRSSTAACPRAGWAWSPRSPASAPPPCRCWWAWPLGERPGALVWVGIAAALPGIWLVSREPGGAGGAGGAARGSGVVDGALAGLGFGGLFVCLAQIPEEAGFLPLALNQLVAGVAVALVATAVRAHRGCRATGPRPSAPSAASSPTLATGAFLLATQTGFLTVAAVITSLYPAVTVVMAATVLREHVHRGQVYGLVLCLAAVALVASG